MSVIGRWSGRRAAAVMLTAGGLALTAAPVSAAGPAPVTAVTLTAARLPQVAPGGASFPGRVHGSIARPAAPQIPQQSTYLSSVYCTSGSSCWAVGEREPSPDTVKLNQMLHWNGRTWYGVAAPSPGGSKTGAYSILYGVRCLSSKDCWAAGEYQRSPGAAIQTQVLHWNGKRWSVVRTPNPGGTGANAENELFDVTCVTSRNCWSVGDFGTQSGIHQKLLNLVLHWNGTRWSRVFLNNPGGTSANHLNSLFSVRCGSASNCVATGQLGTTTAAGDQTNDEAMRWNGRHWYQTPTPNPGGTGYGHFSEIDGLACVGGADCWGAGNFGVESPTLTSQNEMLHWNGKKWAKVTVPNQTPPSSTGLDEFLGATCFSTTNCWAVGNREPTSGAVLNEAEHWNGKHWSVVSTPNPAGTADPDQHALLSARCPSARDCWAVGYQLSTPGIYHNEVLHWNGTKWSVFAAPGT
jgi:hypothetical protein